MYSRRQEQKQCALYGSELLEERMLRIVDIEVAYLLYIKTAEVYTN